MMRGERISSVSVSADGRTILTSSLSFSMRVWDTATGKLLRTLNDDRPVMYAALSADGRTVLSAGKVLKLWDIATGRVLRTFAGHENAVGALALSRDGRFALSGGFDKTARLWDLATGQELHTLRGHTAEVRSVAFSPDGRMVLTASRDGTLKLWDIATGKELRTFTGHEKELSTAAFSPDGRTIVSGGRDQMLKLWDAATGKELRSFTGAFGATASAAFSPDGKTIFSGHGDQTVRVWDVATGEGLLSLTGHESFATTVAVSPNGRFAISGSFDGSTRVWDLIKGREAARMMANGNGEWMTVTPEGFFTASHRDTSLLTIVRGSEVTTSGQVHQSLFNPDLVREALAGDPDGEVSRAANLINLNKVLDAGPPPSVAIVSHAQTSGSNTSLVNVTARITDRGKGIGRIEWRVNNVTSGVTTPPANTGPSYDVTQELALDPGVNQIEVIAYERRNLLASPPARTAMTFEGTEAVVKPRLHILAVGINSYVDKGAPTANSGYFPPLHLAVADARAFAEATKEAAASLYSDVVVTYALDGDATITKLDGLMEKIGRDISPRDTFVFYVAAHGYSTNGRFYMIPQDYQGGGDLAALTGRAIGQERLQSWIANRIKAKKAIILLDTCEAGAVIDGHTASRFAAAASEAAIGRLHEATGRPVLTAAAAGEHALEGYKGHGVFTYALMEALGKGDSNHNGTIETTELAAHVEKRVPEIAAELSGNGRAVKSIATLTMVTARGTGEGKQSAHFGSTGEDFTLVGRLP